VSGLIVPIDVLAYCVGSVDAHGPARSFAGATTNYRNQATDDRPAFLGINVTRTADTAPLWPLESGVHLHWAMPDALTHAATGSGSVAFPPLPNRWLVTRIVGNAQSARHWLIQSDALSSTPPGGNPAPTVPVIQAATTADAKAGTQRGYRYLGAWELLGEAAARPQARSHGPGPKGSDPARLGAERLAELTGSDLHAVATGDIAFAAFYPNCRSSFGFCDDLSDLTAAPVQLLYVVTGWYDGAAHDPVSGGLDLAQLQTQLGWTIDSRSAEPVTYSLYSGLVQGISWDSSVRYLSDEPEPISGDVALGNHPAEALAAYFRGTNHPDLAAFEELLTLYASGSLPSFATPAAGQLAELEELLHELQFSGIDGGVVYTIMRGASEATDLPAPLADALNLLNQLQQAADVAAIQVRQAKWQLFSDWYRAFQVKPQDQQAAFNAFYRQFQLQSPIDVRAQSTATAAANQQAAVQRMLSQEERLTAIPAARYYTPTEPVVLLAGDAAAPCERYGGDGRYHPAGYLACRRDSDVLQALSIAPASTLQASQFAGLIPAAVGQLPHAAIASLIGEAALLDTTIGAAASGIDQATLATDQAAWLEGGTAQHYGHPLGTPPSPVALATWPGANPWVSLMLLWEADFHPLLATSTAGTNVDYPQTFFTANYSLDPNDPRMIAYAPTAGGIEIDPCSIDFEPDHQSGTCRYAGTAVLSRTAADNLRDQLAHYLAGTTDDTLEAIAHQLAATDVALQGLTGFNDALLTRQPSVQLAIGVSPTALLPFRTMTQQITSVIGSLAEIPPLAPALATPNTGGYNPVRAGYMELSLRVMDPFGRKRPVQVEHLYIAESLATRVGGALAPGIAFMQPRLAQASRLLYRWLAADTTEYDEMNSHPATTPVCGWLLPDHLAVGFFLYNAQGNPLGSLTLRADGSEIIWQPTPGDQQTIQADLATVMAGQNPHLEALALVLGGSTLSPPAEGSMTPKCFRAFWQATDRAVTQIVPSAPASQSGLAALVGRPLALVQASLRLERQGLAALDQALSTLSGGQYLDTDHAVGGVQFPVVIGDLQRLDDGLAGYFMQKTTGDGYDLATFFSQAASGSDPGVAVPAADNLLLGPSATPESAPDTPPAETKLLMLVDPRAAVHATTGILPTQSLTIPPDQYEDILAGLELTFPAHPLLHSAGGLQVPLPAAAGCNWSWITDQASGSSSAWGVEPDLEPVTAGAVWQYSPQTLTEGWLRLNPELLRFRLAGPDDTPVLTAGATTSLTLSVANLRAIPITFTPAAIVGETSPTPGSILYIHFGSLVDPAHVAQIQPAAAGWRFQALSDARYGSYWAATPEGAPVTLAAGQQLKVTLANVAVAAGTQVQCRVYFDYYGLVGIDDGIDVALLALQQHASR
jgi:hypothetical protein